MSRPVNSGPGRVLIGLYGLFALAAGARAGVQLALRFDQARLAYILSAVSAAVYLAATVALVRGGVGGRRFAIGCCIVELVGVVAIGTWSVLDPAAFPHDTVWSGYGRGYGYVPLALPVLGLLWLRSAGKSTVE